MIDLSKITLISICDDKYVDKTLLSMQICMSKANFYDQIIITNSEKKHNNINSIYVEKIDLIEYSRICINDLVKYIQSDFCLIVQWDGFIINEKSWTDEFLNYDYIGAPWGYPSDCRNRIGNGGFSLRSKKFLEVSSRIEYTPYDYQVYTELQRHDRQISPEDWFLCYDKYYYLLDNNIKFPPIELAYKFSVEHPSEIKQYDRDDISTYGSFGFHGDFNKAAMNNKYLTKGK